MTLIYHIHPATPNIGNRLIVSATQTLITDIAGQNISLLNMPAKGVDAAIKQGGLTRDTVYDVNQLAAGLLIGPGNLIENNGLTLDATSLAALRVPPLLFSISAGRIFDRKGELSMRSDTMPAALVQALCEKAAGIMVRDQHSKQYLEQLGVTQRIRVVGCPVLALEPERLNLPPVDSSMSDTVLVSLRNPLLMNIPPHLQGRVHQDVRRLIDGLRAAGHDRIALLCHDPRDIRFAAAYPDVPLRYTEDVSRYLGWLRDCSLNISYRVHSLLPCAVLGTAAVHFTYDERAQGLIETAGLQSCAIDYVHAEDAIAQALAASANPEALRSAMTKARSTWAPLVESAREGMREWLSTVSAS